MEEFKLLLIRKISWEDFFVTNFWPVIKIQNQSTETSVAPGVIFLGLIQNSESHDLHCLNLTEEQLKDEADLVNGPSLLAITGI